MFRKCCTKQKVPGHLTDTPEDMKFSFVLNLFGIVTFCLMTCCNGHSNESMPHASAAFADIPHRGLLFSLPESLFNNIVDTTKADFPSSYHSTMSRWWRSFRLWSPVPWRRISGARILKIKLSGSLSVGPSTPVNWMTRLLIDSTAKEEERVDSLADFSRLMMLAANDPRIVGVFIELSSLECEFGMLQEALRAIQYYRQSNKLVIGYSETASEGELFLATSFDEFYMPPEGDLNLRGFSSSAFFLRDILDKLGIEPQVQHIGKYKSFGDLFNRSEISEHQREVTSGILAQTSEHWARTVAHGTNQSVEHVREIWAVKDVLMPADYARRGLILGVKYLDEVHAGLSALYEDATTPLWSHSSHFSSYLERMPCGNS